MRPHSAAPGLAPGATANRRGDAARHRDASITPREQPCRVCASRVPCDCRRWRAAIGHLRVAAAMLEGTR